MTNAAYRKEGLFELTVPERQGPITFKVGETWQQAGMVAGAVN